MNKEADEVTRLSAALQRIADEPHSTTYVASDGEAMTAMDGTQRMQGIARDALGMMTIYPLRGGLSRIDLVYDGGVEMRVAEWVSGIMALILLGLVVGKKDVG